MDTQINGSLVPQQQQSFHIVSVDYLFITFLKRLCLWLLAFLSINWYDYQLILRYMPMPID